MRKAILVSLLVIFVFPHAFSQFREELPLRDRMFFGGSFWMQFGTVTDIECSPLVGLFLTPRFAVATGIKYRYFKVKNDPYVGDGTHIYGFNTFARYYVIPDMSKMIRGLHLSVFAHAEYEGLSLDNYFLANPPPVYSEGRFWINSILVGGGISQKIGQKSSINFMLLYNLNESANSLEDNPIIRIGFSF